MVKQWGTHTPGLFKTHVSDNSFHFLCKCDISGLLSTSVFKMFMLRETISSCCSHSLDVSQSLADSSRRIRPVGAEMQHSSSSVQGFIMTLRKHPSADVCVFTSVSIVCVCVPSPLIVLTRRNVCYTVSSSVSLTRSVSSSQTSTTNV